MRSSFALCAAEAESNAHHAPHQQTPVEFSRRFTRVILVEQAQPVEVRCSHGERSFRRFLGNRSRFVLTLRSTSNRCVKQFFLTSNTGAVVAANTSCFDEEGRPPWATRT